MCLSHVFCARCAPQKRSGKDNIGVKVINLADIICEQCRSRYRGILQPQAFIKSLTDVFILDFFDDIVNRCSHSAVYDGLDVISNQDHPVHVIQKTTVQVMVDFLRCRPSHEFRFVFIQDGHGKRGVSAIPCLGNKGCNLIPHLLKPPRRLPDIIFSLRIGKEFHRAVLDSVGNGIVVHPLLHLA